MPHIEVYSTPNCPFCVSAKTLLKSKNLSFKEIDVSEDVESLQKMVRLSGLRTVPQIFINNNSIGGFDELSQMNTDGHLPHLES
ncbi:MAG: glutaredoxin 3 [Gammaproteobacteria bacterium]|nr:glutaredoxin 3 [Gammaproteobacteria bacterium]